MSNRVLVFWLIDYYKAAVKRDFSIVVKMILIHWCWLAYCLADKAVLLSEGYPLVFDQDFDCCKRLFGHFQSFNKNETCWWQNLSATF